MNMKGITKTQADIVSQEAPVAKSLTSEVMEDLPGLRTALKATEEQKKAMFMTVLRSRPFVSKFNFSLGDFKGTKTELVNIGGIADLHLRSYEEIAAIFVAATKAKRDFVGFTYEIREDKTGQVQGRLEVEFGAKVTEALKGFKPTITLEYMN
jgi:hypothetical protein